MNFLHNFILIILTLAIFNLHPCFAQTQKSEVKDVENAKIIPVKNFQEKLKTNALNKTHKSKESSIKSKFDNLKFRKNKGKALKVNDETKKKFNIEDDKIEKTTVNAQITKNKDDKKTKNPKRNFFKRNKKDNNKKVKKENTNVDITSQRMDYDPETENIIASGNARVYFAKEDTTLYANKIVFNHQHNKITAKGKVRMVKDGKWVYGDYIIIDMNFGNSLIENPITEDTPA